VSRLFFIILIWLFVVIKINAAEPLSLSDATERALNTDPRISEVEAFVEHAKAMLEEAEGSDDLTVSANAFVGLSPAVDGGFFKEDCSAGNTCKSRRDRYNLSEGFSPWFNLQYGIIKPLKTFGKIESYTLAAKQNIKLKELDVRLQRGAIILDVNKAYFGYLAAKNTRLFLEDIQKRIDSAVDLVQGWLDDEEGEATQSDLFALQSASALAHSYVVKAKALETISIEGLKVLTGIDSDVEVVLADSTLSPVELPESKLSEFKSQALTDRPEMKQLNHGLKASRALVKAKKAMNKPNLYAGLVGMVSYSPLRDRIDNPYVYDPFNDVGATPIVGLKWDWAGGVNTARAKQAQAELNALVEKNAFARKGIPYQVTEAYTQMHAYHESVISLKKSAKAARKWMISSYTDFEAGLQPVDKMVGAFQAYVLSYTDYLKTVFDYNMQVAELNQVTGAYQ